MKGIPQTQCAVLLMISVYTWMTKLQYFPSGCAGQVLKEFDESNHIRTVTIDLGTVNRKFTYFICHRSPTGQKGPGALDKGTIVMPILSVDFEAKDDTTGVLEHALAFGFLFHM